jgi:hypothetical protein
MGEQIRVTPTLRVEAGPARKKAIATKEMVGDQDSRAKLPDGTVLAKHYKLGLKDAFGKLITEGEEFTFLDYFGPEVWYFYQLEDVELEADMLGRMARSLGMPVSELTAGRIAEWFGVSPVWVQANPWRMKRFIPRSVHPTKAEALAAAEALKE